MKKRLLLTIIMSFLLLTGCTKNYKTITEYSNAMQQVQNRFGSYIIEAVIITNDVDAYCKSFVKGDKWKTEISRNNGKTYQEGSLYDGKEVYSYSKKENVATVIPLKRIFAQKGISDSRKVEFAKQQMNPIGILLHWDIVDENKNLDKLWKFEKKNENKNGYTCRMLKYIDGDEICVSDKYGIAVYTKIVSNKDGKNVEINVKKISNNPLSKYDLELPAGTRIMSIDEIFKNMANIMK